MSYATTDRTCEKFCSTKKSGYHLHDFKALKMALQESLFSKNQASKENESKVPYEKIHAHKIGSEESWSSVFLNTNDEPPCH